MEETILAFNGIDDASGVTCSLLSPAQLSALVRGQALSEGDQAQVKELKNWMKYLTQIASAHFGVKEGVDPNNLAETGWGVIFAHDSNPAVREALGELLAWRRNRRLPSASTSTGNTSWQTATARESKQAFLERHGAGPGPADPEKSSYYLLIVGDPGDSLPLQYQLDVQYAVGRII
jgi:hypothetical protein